MKEILERVLGEVVDAAVITQLNETFTRAVCDAVESAKQEAAAAHSAEVTSLRESVARQETQLAEQSAETIRTLTEKVAQQEELVKQEARISGELIETLKESMTKLNEKHVEEIKTLNEHAQEYSEYVKQQLTEKASSYVTKFVDEYQKLHESEFKKLEEYNRVVGLFENFRSVISAHGYDTDEDLKYQVLEEKVNQIATERDQLASQAEELQALRESLELEVGKERFLRESTSGMSESEVAGIVSLVEKLKPKTIDEYTTVFNTLKERKLSTDTKTTTQLNESVKAQPTSVNTTVKTNNDWV